MAGVSLACRTAAWAAWAAWATWVGPAAAADPRLRSGPERNSVPQITAPVPKIAAATQKQWCSRGSRHSDAALSEAGRSTREGVVFCCACRVTFPG